MISKSIIYISSARCGVIDSQVLSLLIEIKSKQFFDRVILLAGVKRNQNWNQELSILLKSELEIILFKQYPNYSIFHNLQKKEFYFVLKRILNDNTVIHLRGESFCNPLRHAVNLLNYLNVKIVTDIRGAGYEETKLYNKLKPIQHQLRLRQHKKALISVGKNSDSISCVSKTLKHYVLQRTKLENNNIFLNHCIAGKDFAFSQVIRNQYRNKLKLASKDIVFVFMAGGISNWQNTQEIINSIAEKGYKLLNLSKQEIKINNVINLYVPYKEVPHYLNAADIGIVWRNSDTVNKVASPVKFSEYVCTGLPVIANNGVDLVNDYIGETGFGKIINNFNQIDNALIEKLRQLNRNTISNNAKGKFSIEVIANNYFEIYKKLLTDN